jgi:myo-inositol-1(or 4)-monophosphatase
MSSPNLHPMLNVAVKAARAAGAIINRAALDVERSVSRRSRSTTSSPKSTTPAKRRSSKPCSPPIPRHGILAEESGSQHGAKHASCVWIIDPLDGTTNFIHGFPVYCVSIALAVRGKVEQAVIYDPSRNDLFTATKGRGAYLNDRRIRVASARGCRSA